MNQHKTLTRYNNLIQRDYVTQLQKEMQDIEIHVHSTQVHNEMET